MSINVNVGGNTGPLERDVRAAMDRINRAGGLKIRVDDKGVTQPLGNMKRSADEFSKSLEASNARVLAFGASVGIINAVSNAFKGLVEQTIKVEKNLTDINVVMGLTAKQLDKFGGGLFKVAAETGAGFQAASEAATEFARQGLSVAETLKRTKDALVLTRLTGMKATESVKSLTAAMNTFKGEVHDSTVLVSKFAAVDVKFAVSAEDFAQAIARAGASARDAGVDINELIGIVTAVQERTARGGAVIGNAFKTIFTRLRRGSTLQELENIGIAVRDMQGSTLPAMKILDQLAKRYDTLTDSQKSYVSQNVAGVFQINMLKAAMADLGQANSVTAQATSIASKATDESNQKNEQLRNTMAALATETGVAIQELAKKIGDIALAPGINKILDGIKGMADWANNLLGDGEQEGNRFAKGLLAGVGNFLSGPGLVILTAVVSKLFVNASKYGVQSLQSLLGMNKAALSRKHTEQAILQVLASNSALSKEMLRTDISREKKEQMILSLIRQQTTEAQKLAAVSKQLTLPLVRAGVTPNLSMRRAEGFIPNFAADKSERQLAQQAGYSAGAIKQMNIPGVGDVTYNTAETVKKFPGMTQPAIIPPAESRASGPYAAAFMGAHGFSPYAGRGYVPNFAAKGFTLDNVRGAAGIKKGGDIHSGSIVRGATAGSMRVNLNSVFPEAAKTLAVLTGEGPEELGLEQYSQPLRSVVGLRRKIEEHAKSKKLSPAQMKGVSSVLSRMGAQVSLPTKGIYPVSQKDIAAGSGQPSTWQQKLSSTSGLSRAMDNLANGMSQRLFGSSHSAVTNGRALQHAMEEKAWQGYMLEAGVKTALKRNIDKGVGGQRAFDIDKNISSSMKSFMGGNAFDAIELKNSVSAGKGESGNMSGKVFTKLSSEGKMSQNDLSRALLPVLTALGGTAYAQSKKRASGFIPNYADPLSDAIGRERGAGVPVSKIRVGTHRALQASSNPMGLGVTNTSDEPRGLRDVFGASGFIPNFFGPFSRGAQGSRFMNPISAQMRTSTARGGWQQMDTRAIKAMGIEARKIANAFRRGTIDVTEMGARVDLLGKNAGLTGTSLKVLQTQVKTAGSKLGVVGNFKAGLSGGGTGISGGLGRFQSGEGKGMMAGMGRLAQGVGGMGAMMALSMGAGMVDGIDDPTNSSAQQKSGAMSGAATGMAIGMMAGPIGMAAGALGGALYGLVSAANKAQEAIEAETKARKEQDHKRGQQYGSSLGEMYTKYKSSMQVDHGGQSFGEADFFGLQSKSLTSSGLVQGDVSKRLRSASMAKYKKELAFLQEKLFEGGDLSRLGGVDNAVKGFLDMDMRSAGEIKGKRIAATKNLPQGVDRKRLSELVEELGSVEYMARDKPGATGNYGEMDKADFMKGFGDQLSAVDANKIQKDMVLNLLRQVNKNEKDFRFRGVDALKNTKQGEVRIQQGEKGNFSAKELIGQIESGGVSPSAIEGLFRQMIQSGNTSGDEAGIKQREAIEGMQKRINFERAKLMSDQIVFDQKNKIDQASLNVQSSVQSALKLYGSALKNTTKEELRHAQVMDRNRTKLAKAQVDAAALYKNNILQFLKSDGGTGLGQEMRNIISSRTGLDAMADTLGTTTASSFEEILKNGDIDRAISSLSGEDLAKFVNALNEGVIQNEKITDQMKIQEQLKDSFLSKANKEFSLTKQKSDLEHEINITLAKRKDIMHDLSQASKVQEQATRRDAFIMSGGVKQANLRDQIRLAKVGGGTASQQFQASQTANRRDFLLKRISNKSAQDKEIQSSFGKEIFSQTGFFDDNFTVKNLSKMSASDRTKSMVTRSKKISQDMKEGKTGTKLDHRQARVLKKSGLDVKAGQRYNIPSSTLAQVNQIIEEKDALNRYYNEKNVVQPYSSSPGADEKVGYYQAKGYVSDNYLPALMRANEAEIAGIKGSMGPDDSFKNFKHVGSKGGPTIEQTWMDRYRAGKLGKTSTKDAGLFEAFNKSQRYQESYDSAMRNVGKGQEIESSIQSKETTLASQSELNQQQILSVSEISEKLSEQVDLQDKIVEKHLAQNSELEQTQNFMEELQKIQHEFVHGQDAFANGMQMAFKDANDRAATFSHRLGKVLPETFAKNMSDAMMKVIREGSDWEDALRGAAIGVLDQLNQMFTQQMMDQAFGSMFDEGEDPAVTATMSLDNAIRVDLTQSISNLSTNISSLTGAITAMPKAAVAPAPGTTSGQVHTPSSGSVNENYHGGPVRLNKGGQVPSMLTNGEFVMGKEAVSRLGIGSMAELNQGRIPKFNEGGFAEGFGNSLASGAGAMASGLLMKELMGDEEDRHKKWERPKDAFEQNRAWKRNKMSANFMRNSEGVRTEVGEARQAKEKELQKWIAKQEEKQALGRQVVQLVGNAVTAGAMKEFSSDTGWGSSVDEAGVKHSAFDRVDAGLGIQQMGRNMQSWALDKQGYGPSGEAAMRPMNDADYANFDKYNQLQKDINDHQGKTYWTALKKKMSWTGRYTGGKINGPAGIDKVPAMLTEGEYVINANAARKIGIPALEKINAGRFNEGGLVGETTKSSEASSAGGMTNNINISVNVEGGNAKDGAKSGDSSGSDQKTRMDDLSKKIKQQVVMVIKEENRPGGLLG